jgi:pentatricopeptide repeat protein
VFLDKGEQSFNKWNQAIPHRKSIAQAHQLFVEDFLTAELNLSLKAVNTLLHACYRAGLADIALDVFHNLYKYQRTTPDEEGMRFLMCVLSKQLSRTPDTYKHLLNIWQGIKESHGGDPPLWCYVRFTEPVARFCSIEDFRYLLGIVISYNGKVQDLKLSLEDYNCLIRSCCTAGDKASAIHVLHYALSQGVVPEEQILFSLLLMIKHPKDLDWYFEVSY